MTGSLTNEEIETYHEDGFIKPIVAFSVEDAKAIRDEIEALERNYSNGQLPHDLTPDRPRRGTRDVHADCAGNADG